MYVTLTINTKKMRKLTLVILIAVLLVSCKKEQKRDYVVLSGKVETPITDSLTIQNNFREILQVIKLNDGNTFDDTLKLPAKGFYYLSDGQNDRQLYLEPGFETNVSLDFKNNHTVFSGDGANENNYLVQKELLSDSIRKFDDYHYYGQLDENDFLSMSDSVYNIKVNLFNKYASTFDSAFTFLEKNALKYQKLQKQALYESSKRLVTGNKDFKVSPEYYPTLYKGIDLSGGELTNIPDYVYFVDSYIWEITNKQLQNNDSTDFYLTYLENVETVIRNEKLKRALAFQIGNYKLSRTSELDKVYGKIKNILSDSNNLKIVERKYQILKKVEKGAVSPSFKLENINGKLVSLEDLKGHYVYIDIWSPSCLPCMEEIPFLKEMEKKYHNRNIRFVSICVAETKVGWKKFVKDRKLTGIQLFAPEQRISFFSDYLVRVIPRFILIDKEGKIIDANAKRPSNPKLKEEINKLI